MLLSSTSSQDIVLKLSSSSSSFFKWLHFTLIRLLKFPKRSQLPSTLFEWNRLALPPREQQKYDENECRAKLIWRSLAVIFGEHGFTLFEKCASGNQQTSKHPSPSNYIYYPANGFITDRVRGFWLPCGTYHAARKNNRHYTIRVISAGGQGLNHLQIIRMLSNTVPDNLYSNYHILPMVEEIVYQDITFGVFPLAFGHLQEILNPNLTKTTLEEALHLIMQALEAIMYIHGKNIAHRDLYTDNFLVDFFPNSLVEQHWARPRIYLSDFETAVCFPEDSKPSERLVSGFPFGHFGLDVYGRNPCAPELLMSETHTYCPFQLDIFQFGSHLNKFLKTTGVEELDSLWPPFISQYPEDRPKPHVLYEKLGDFINKTPPKNLQRTWSYVPPRVFLKRAKVV